MALQADSNKIVGSIHALGSAGFPPGFIFSHQWKYTHCPASAACAMSQWMSSFTLKTMWQDIIWADNETDIVCFSNGAKIVVPIFPSSYHFMPAEEHQPIGWVHLWRCSSSILEPPGVTRWLEDSLDFLVLLLEYGHLWKVHLTNVIHHLILHVFVLFPFVQSLSVLSDMLKDASRLVSIFLSLLVASTRCSNGNDLCLPPQVCFLTQPSGERAACEGFTSPYYLGD